MSNGRNIFNKYKKLIDFFVKLISLIPRPIRKNLFANLRYTSGKKGILLRYIVLKSLVEKIGNNVSIFQGVYLLNFEQISIGDNVSIHPMSYIEGFGGLKIGNDVSIAHSVTLLTVNHNYINREIPIKYQGLESRPLVINDNVWIGAKSTILGGNIIQSGSIIAAGAVVSTDVDENSVYGGVPAKKIKNRLEF